jgi:hypothetical protein
MVNISLMMIRINRNEDAHGRAFSPRFFDRKRGGPLGGAARKWNKLGARSVPHEAT